MSKKAVIYARVSTADQTTDGQIAELKEFAEKQNWDIVEVVKDVCSGGLDSKERNGLSRVFSLAHKKKFDILLVWSLDRFSREGSRKTIGYLSELENFGVAWHSYSEPYISTVGVFSDAVVALLSALARQEKIRLSERTRLALKARKDAGVTLGRPRVPAERISQARALRMRGLSFSEIGREMGISRVRAFQLVKTGICG